MLNLVKMKNFKHKYFIKTFQRVCNSVHYPTHKSKNPEGIKHE